MFDTVFSTFKDTIKSVVDDIDKDRTKRYFRIKKGVLYWYLKQTSDKAQNEIDIKSIEQVEIQDDDPKSLLISYKDKLYKFEGTSPEYIEEWYKSIELVRSKSEEYLDLDRYVDMKIFERKNVNGKEFGLE